MWDNYVYITYIYIYIYIHGRFSTATLNCWRAIILLVGGRSNQAYSSFTKWDDPPSRRSCMVVCGYGPNTCEDTFSKSMPTITPTCQARWYGVPYFKMFGAQQSGHSPTQSFMHTAADTAEYNSIVYVRFSCQQVLSDSKCWLCIGHVSSCVIFCQLLYVFICNYHFMYAGIHGMYYDNIGIYMIMCPYKHYIVPWNICWSVGQPRRFRAVPQTRGSKKKEQWQGTKVEKTMGKLRFVTFSDGVPAALEKKTWQPKWQKNDNPIDQEQHPKNHQQYKRRCKCNATPLPPYC